MQVGWPLSRLVTRVRDRGWDSEGHQHCDSLRLQDQEYNTIHIHWAGKLVLAPFLHLRQTPRLGVHDRRAVEASVGVCF